MPNAKDPQEFARELLRQITFNIAIGNADAHSKNYSLLIDKQGLVEMAPLYDAAPIFVMNSTYHHSGHAVNGQTNLVHITVRHLIAEAGKWGLPPASAEPIIRETLESVAAAIPATPSPHPATHNLAEAVAKRCELLLAMP